LLEAGMSNQPPKRPVRARSGLRPAPGKSGGPPVPGQESSQARGKSRDARHAHDKDGNEEARRELPPESKTSKR
jgi:hypothetical protein